MKNPEELPQQIALLRESLEQKERTIAALTDRVKKSIRSSGNSFNVFESNILLQEEVARQTKKLQAVTEEARSSNESKSYFLASMSHEVRTPMNAIIGLSRLALETDIERERSDYLVKINTAAESLLRIINDILDFSKIEAGKIQIERHPFLLHEVFNQVKSIIKEKIVKKGLDFSVKTDFVLEERIVGDSTRLQQILINLVNNSVKFTEQGQVQLLASMLHREESGLTIQFSVRDTGIGMSSEAQRTIFDKYNQANSFTTRKFGGTGLGLSIVQELVQLMGGSIQVKSELAQGSEFFFSLDFDRITENSTQKYHSQEVSLSQDDIKSLEGLKILLVEDNLINQDVAKAMLNQKGMEVEIAENGQEAIDMLDKQIYDCVLMDIQMPVMDGLTATKILRKDERFATLPILAMTANALVEDVEKSLDAGMNCHISKPINVALLFKEIADWVSYSRKVPQSPDKKKLPGSSSTEPTLAEHGGHDFNMREALERVGGNKELFLKIITTFLEQHGTDYKQVKEYLDQGRKVDAGKIIHSLKGVALIVGSRELHNTVKEIDGVLSKGQENDLTSLLEEFKEKLDGTVLFLSEFLSKNSGVSSDDSVLLKKRKTKPIDRPRLLVVDDEEITLKLLVDILSADCQVQTSMDGTEALGIACKEPQPALILLDVSMPSMDGYELCRALKSETATKNIPVIFITSRDGEKDEIHGFEAGAVDYIYKPIRKAIVLARIKLHLELKRERDFHARRSLIDGLTEIPNRRRFMEHLSHELRRAQRQKSELSVIMLDIDYFKLFNDNYGHLEGDDALKLVAEMVYQKMQRPNDLVGRYGGEEFVCILPETDGVGAVEICRLLLRVISELQIPHAFSEVSDVLTISIGAVSLIPDKSITGEKLLRVADEQLYKSKNAGRNRYTCTAL